MLRNELNPRRGHISRQNQFLISKQRRTSLPQIITIQVPLSPSNGEDTISSYSSDFGGGGGGGSSSDGGGGNKKSNERGATPSSEEVGEGSIEIQQNRQKRTKGATCDCCLTRDETVKGTQWHSVCLGWRVAVALATNQFHRCLNVQDIAICHKCYQLTSGALREACARVVIAHPDIDGLQSFIVPSLPEKLKALQVCFNSRGVIGCFDALHTALRPGHRWFVLPAPIGAQVFLIPGEGDSWSGIVVLVSVNRGMVTVSDASTTGTRDSRIIVNHTRIFRPDDIIHPSSQTTKQQYPVSLDISHRDSIASAVAETQNLARKNEEAKGNHETEISCMKLRIDAATIEVSIYLTLV